MSNRLPDTLPRGVPLKIVDGEAVFQGTPETSIRTEPDPGRVWWVHDETLGPAYKDSDGNLNPIGTGDPGEDGEPGASAYEIAVANGFVGSEAEWLESLVGPQGPGAAEFHGVRVYRSTTQSLTNNAYTVLSFSATDFDTDSYWSAGAPTKLTIPEGLEGYYLVEGAVGIQEATGGQRLVIVCKNAPDIPGGSYGTLLVPVSESNPGSAGVAHEVLSTVRYLDAGDYVEIAIYQNSGSSKNSEVGAVSGNYIPSLGLTLISGVKGDPGDPGEPGAGSVDLTGDTGSATGITDITFDGADVTDDGGGAATVTITGGGGGGITRTTVGTTSIGASFDGTRRTYLKKVTLPSACLVASIMVGVKGNAGNNTGLAAAVFADSSGSPTNIVAVGQPTYKESDGSTLSNTLMNTTARTVQLPVGAWLTAGDYWLAVILAAAADSRILIAYAGSGSDKVQAVTVFSDVSVIGTSNTSNDYSIAANLVT